MRAQGTPTLQPDHGYNAHEALLIDQIELLKQKKTELNKRVEEKKKEMLERGTPKHEVFKQAYKLKKQMRA